MPYDGLVMSDVEVKELKQRFVKGSGAIVFDMGLRFVAQTDDEVEESKAFLDFIRKAYKDGGRVIWRISAIPMMRMDPPIRLAGEDAGQEDEQPKKRRRRTKEEMQAALGKGPPSAAVSASDQAAIAEAEKEKKASFAAASPANAVGRNDTPTKVEPPAAKKQDPETAAAERRKRVAEHVGPVAPAAPAGTATTTDGTVVDKKTGEVLSEAKARPVDPPGRPIDMLIPPKAFRKLRIEGDGTKQKLYMERVASPSCKFTLQMHGLEKMAEGYPEEVPVDWWTDTRDTKAKAEKPPAVEAATEKKFLAAELPF